MPRRAVSISAIRTGTPTRSAAALGLLWLRRRAPSRASSYVARVFELLWIEAADIADPAVIEGALGDRARGFRDYAAGPGPDELAAHQRELAEAGVSSVPDLRDRRRAVPRPPAPADGRVARHRTHGPAADLIRDARARSAGASSRIVDDDQVVPIADSGLLSAKLVQNGP